ncbi:MAG: hypothetical protein DME42_11005 [Verrucomicrobia bacterium]|nr:MAG: hypothetical protein DME42_11005 [Verrucomicrobiota bacterium]
MNQTKFFAELKRRNVYKVAVAYAIVGWLVVQIATQVFPFLEIPNWVVRLVIALVTIGFPIALIIAWAFELTPGGIKRTEDVDPSVEGGSKGRTWIYVAVIGAAVSVGLFFVGRYSGQHSAGRAGTELPAKSIAVLPFDSLSRDPDNAFFAEGVQDEILTRLNILEGSVQKVNDQVRVNVQLINALTNAHLWADIYDRKLTDIFAVESDIAKTIADTLQAKLTGSEKTAMSKKPTANPEAYQLYLKGRFFWDKRTGADLQTAIQYFNQAIAKDPGYALAYAGLADAYALLTAYGASSIADSFPQAKAAARKALELDGSLAEAHTSLGQVLLFYDLDFQAAANEFQRAIALNPNYATAHHWYGNGPPTVVGDFDTAIAELKRAQQLDPLSLIINADLGVTFFLARRYDEAITQLRKTIEMEPHFYYAHWNLGQALELKGQLMEALAEYKKAAELNEDPLIVALVARAYAKLGQRDEALKRLEELQQAATRRYVPNYAFALVYAALGDKAKAMDWLEHAYRDHVGPELVLIKVDPMLDPLRGDARFEALAEKIVPAREFHVPSK